MLGDARHEPIIDVATWEAAQAMVAGQDRVGSRPGRKPGRHLFVNGHLRCVNCGSAMQTRSGKTPAEDQYVCATHRRHVQRDGDTSSCPTGWHKREAIDGVFLALFERSFLDYESTRAKVAAALDVNLTDVQAQVQTADTGVAKLERKRQKIDADYYAEELGAAAYTRLSEQVAEELVGAMNQLEMLRQRADRIAADRENVDAESETLRKLTALRDTVASITRDLDAEASDDLDTLRGVLAAAFGTVFLPPDGKIAGLRPGARMLTAGASKVVQIAHPAEGDGEPYPFNLDTDTLDMNLNIERVALPLSSYSSGATNEKVTSRTL